MEGSFRMLTNDSTKQMPCATILKDQVINEKRNQQE